MTEDALSYSNGQAKSIMYNLISLVHMNELLLSLPFKASSFKGAPDLSVLLETKPVVLAEVS